MGLIFLCLLAGINLQTWLGIAIPGSIIGLLDPIWPDGQRFSACRMGQTQCHPVYSLHDFTVRPDQCRLDGALRYATGKPRPILASAIGGTLIVMVTLGLILDRMLKKGKKSCG